MFMANKQLFFKGVLILTSIFLCSLSYGQDGDEQGEIKDVEIEVVTSREIKLPTAEKNFEKVKTEPVNQTRPDLNYRFATVNYLLPDLNIRLRPRRLTSPTKQKIYGNHVKLGYGNFGTPYAEGFFNNKRDKQKNYGAHVKFLRSNNGPVDDENSGSGVFGADVYGRYFGKSASLGGSLAFDRRNYHFYGYPPGTEVSSDTIEQGFNHFGIKGDLQSTDADNPLQYNLGVAFDYLQDDFEARESEIGLDIGITYDLDDEAKIVIESQAYFINQQDELIDSQSRTLFRLRPSYQFNVNGFRVKAGFNVAYENDTLGSAGELHFYPDIEASYPISDEIDIVAGLTGDIEKTSLRRFSEENPFISTNVPVFHSNKQYEFYGALRGKLSSSLAFNTGFSVANYRNLYFFVNNATDQSRFDLLYEPESTSRFNYFVEVSYSNSDIFRAIVRGDYFGYSPDSFEEAWHRPGFKLSLLSTYNLVNKIRFNADFYIVGGINAFDTETAGAIDLDTALDLNLKGEYIISNQFSAFLSFNNIFSNEYQLLLNYPTRGLQVLAGITYSF